jgi:general secretion pathway protein D
MPRAHCHFYDAAARCRPLALAAALAVVAGAQAQNAPPSAPVVNAQTADAPASKPNGRDVMLDFANAEIDAVARTMATITGRNVVVDPRVKGAITLTTTTPVPPAEALQLFAVQLRTQGFALVESNGLYLVVPEAEAKLQGGAVSAGARPAGGGQIATQIFRLSHENANTLVPVLRPLISPNNTINVSPGTNAIIITDYADNLQRLGRIIAALDVANATDVEVVRLQHAVASDLAPLVAKLLEPGGSATAAQATPQPAPNQPGAAAQAAALSAGSGDGYRTTLAAEPRSNSIIIRAANPARLALAKRLIEQLDQPPSARADGASGNIRVVFLKNADAAKLAVTLRAALAALPGQPAGAAGGGNAATGGGLQGNMQNQMMNAASNNSGGMTGLSTGPTINAAANNQPSTGGQIQADPATNSLIISAPEPVYRELRAVIDQLDQRRAQVFVESLIAEVRADKAADFGVQWQGLMGNARSTIGVIGTNYSVGNQPNIINLGAQFAGGNLDNWKPSETSVMPNTGFNLIAGTRTLAVLANFIQSTGAGNVLSTPTLLTLDNEEAKISVGQNVPIKTGSYATNTGVSNGISNPFQTFDRQDVGLTLRVRPQISADGTIKLVIYQETSSLGRETADGFITNKRAIESSVMVDDGAIVVLGGLLEDTYASAEDKVPVLGDVPVLGNLFRSNNRSYIKTNLMVFLRPVIVRDAAAAESYSLDRYEMMRSAQQSAQPQPSSVLQINALPVLPPITPVREEPAARPPPRPLIDPTTDPYNLPGYGGG